MKQKNYKIWNLKISGKNKTNMKHIFCDFSKKLKIWSGFIFEKWKKRLNSIFGLCLSVVSLKPQQKNWVEWTFNKFFFESGVKLFFFSTSHLTATTLGTQKESDKGDFVLKNDNVFFLCSIEKNMWFKYFESVHTHHAFGSTDEEVSMGADVACFNCKGEW